MAEPTGENGAGNAEQYGDDTPARVAPGHEELRYRAGNAANHDPADDSIMLHPTSPCNFLSFERPSARAKQRALAKQVPLFVEKQWRSGDWRGLLHAVTY
jgi:hypothetical protein